MSAMSANGEYAPSTARWVRDQVELYEGSGGTSGTTMRGMPVIIVTTLGVKSGKVRKVPLMRVEHDGEYAAVASQGGAPKNPSWYYNLVADPNVEVRDGTVVRAMPACDGDLVVASLDGRRGSKTVVGQHVVHAVAAQQPQGLARRHGEADPVHRQHVAVTLGQALYLDCIHSAGLEAWRGDAKGKIR